MSRMPSETELDRATDTEYAAISVVAIVGLVLSVLGAAALLLPAAFLVVVPAAGLALSVLALVRIRRSHGTLTGAGVAVAGMAVGAILAVVSGAHFALDWHRESSELALLKASSLEVADDLAAGRYDKVLERIPAERRGPGGATAEVLAAKFSKLFADAGPVTDRRLLALEIHPTETDTRVAVARVRVAAAKRVVEVTVIWASAPPAEAARSPWQLVGGFGEETIESATGHEQAARQALAPPDEKAQEKAGP